MATKEEVTAQLQTVSAAVTKIGEETTSLVAKVQELQDAIDNAGDDVPAEIATLVGEIAEKINAVDALVPDVPAPTPAPAPNPSPDQ